MALACAVAAGTLDKLWGMHSCASMAGHSWGVITFVNPLARWNSGSAVYGFGSWLLQSFTDGSNVYAMHSVQVPQLR